MATKPGMPPELMAMMQRYNQLGRLLPKDPDAVDLKNPNVRAEVGIVLAEMKCVWAQINAFLDAARARRMAS